MNTSLYISWNEDGRRKSTQWYSESRDTPPARTIAVDDTIKADTAYRYACEGTAMLWRGDFQNAKQLLNAIARRIDRPRKKPLSPPASPAEAFHRHRQAVSQRTRILGMVLIELEPDYTIRLGRAPDIRQAFTAAHGPDVGPCVLPLREILGIIGAYEWHRKGIEIPALKGRINPCYGVFPPTRNEYVDLVMIPPLPSSGQAFDIGTGTGIIAAILAGRGVASVMATDNNPRAVACASANIKRLGLSHCIHVIQTDLFPPGKANLIVCNPPWIPARPLTPLEHGIYDPESLMLKAFLHHLPNHLDPNGEAWLILSDIAEHLGLRTRNDLTSLFLKNGLEVIEKIDVRPIHPKAADPKDPLHEARKAETTSLWRLSFPT